jgi:hypothetical protein
MVGCCGTNEVKSQLERIHEGKRKARRGNSRENRRTYIGAVLIPRDRSIVPSDESQPLQHYGE